MAARVLSRHVTVTDPEPRVDYTRVCLLYTSDAADE